ncbi:hypothetical protein GCM10011375_33130 [Hymenobacter qilianensis]|uniref:Uncharacterized protein n=1 Tax=Hymenobacter qilianensis TaxID=1385715 RepID=A0ACB5PV70_9BACT|nr:hypothetical protein GCM10011375_33130 [Hymenobacter qilianensis]
MIKPFSFVASTIVLAIVTSCSDKSREEPIDSPIIEKSSDDKVHEFIHLESPRLYGSNPDTISIAEQKPYRRKVYMGSDAFYRIAKRNGISSYLHTNFQLEDDPDIVVIQSELKFDTCYFTIQPKPNTQYTHNQSLIWRCAFKIDYTSTHKGTDTAFVIRDRIYLQ